MKKIVIASLLIAFILFFVSIGLVIVAALNMKLALMYAGIVILIISLVIYLVLIIICASYWYKNKMKEE